MSEITESNLVGYVNHDNIGEPDHLKIFLRDLEKLMITHKIIKVDISFKPNWAMLEEEESSLKHL